MKIIEVELHQSIRLPVKRKHARDSADAVRVNVERLEGLTMRVDGSLFFFEAPGLCRAVPLTAVKHIDYEVPRERPQAEDTAPREVAATKAPSSRRRAKR